MGTRASIADTCASIAAELAAGDELLVVVDGDGVPPLPEPGATTRVVHQRRAGLGAARDRALHEAIGDVVCFVDDDETVHHGWRRAIVAAFADERVAAAGGTILARWPDGRPPRWLHEEMRPAFGERPRGTTRPPFGGNFAVDRSAALAAGGFRPDLGHGEHRPGLHEELELCTRLVAAGRTVADAPDAVVTHHLERRQVSRRWVLCRGWYQGKADAALAEATGTPDDVRRTAKFLGLCVFAPIALLFPRTGTYVVMRLLVNAGYLWTRLPPRRRPDAGTLDR